MHAQNSLLDITDRKCTINIQHIAMTHHSYQVMSHKQRKVRISSSGRDLKQFSPGVTEKKNNLAYPDRKALEKTLQNKLSEKEVVSPSLLYFEDTVPNTLSQGKRRNLLIPGNIELQFSKSVALRISPIFIS